MFFTSYPENPLKVQKKYTYTQIDTHSNPSPEKIKSHSGHQACTRQTRSQRVPGARGQRPQAVGGGWEHHTVRRSQRAAGQSLQGATTQHHQAGLPHASSWAGTGLRTGNQVHSKAPVNVGRDET